MKIGSGANTNFMMLTVNNVPEKKEEEISDNLQAEKVDGGEAEMPKNQISKRPESLNMMASSFVHADGANDSGNYSLMNLKGFKSNENLMTKFNSFMTDLIADRLAFTDELIESGVSIMDAKYAAAAKFEKMGVDAHKKLVSDITEEELEKEAKEAEEFNKERTEEVLGDKQEEKATEVKESEEKVEEEIEEKVTDSSVQSVEGASAGEEVNANGTNTTSDVNTDSVAAPVEATTADSQVSSSAADEGLAIKGSGTGENIDKLI